MKYLDVKVCSYCFLLLALLFSCTSKTAEVEKEITTINEQKTIFPAFDSILATAQLDGSILLYDLAGNHYYSNDFDWAEKGRLPASTFKIPNSIIALETGVVESDSSIFKWDGTPRRLKNWEQDLTLKQAFHFSCVPCYQQVARGIGASRMNSYLHKMNYGSMDVDSSNIDLFWLSGDSKISQFQQVDFLKRLYLSNLPIKPRTESIIREMMVIEENEHYKISGKTGWSIRNGHNNGWFVGYIETGKKTWFFATNVDPEADFSMDMFPVIRKKVTYEALKVLSIMK